MLTLGGLAVTNAGRVGYWVVAVFLVGFGVAAILSIGMPFLATGIALLALAPFRRRPAVFWPWLVGVVTFFVGYVVVAPLGCWSQEAVGVADGGRASAVVVAGGDVACPNLLGVAYRGGPGYDPPLWPALLIGAVAALGAGLAIRILLSRRAGRSGAPSGRQFER